MKPNKCRRRCPDCRKRTEHVVLIGRLQGRGQDAYQDYEYRCQDCGHVSNAKRYPNLLSGFFSVTRSSQCRP